jgi:hypothetical protein
MLAAWTQKPDSVAVLHPASAFPCAIPRRTSTPDRSGLQRSTTPTVEKAWTQDPEAVVLLHSLPASTVEEAWTQDPHAVALLHPCGTRSDVDPSGTQASYSPYTLPYPSSVPLTYGVMLLRNITSRSAVYNILRTQAPQDARLPPQLEEPYPPLNQTKLAKYRSGYLFAVIFRTLS